MNKLRKNSRCEPASKAAARIPSDQLLDWYDKNARVLAWRIAPQNVPQKTGSNLFADPYRVWLSEIMLQQTQVKTVHEYYLKFLRKWPTLEHLANAELEAVLKAWAGLGYYSRARNLKKCAQIVASQYGGNFPSTAAELKQLPGIGDYTSAAIAAIAFGEPVAVVDGNVERVMARKHAIKTPVKQIKGEIKSLTQKLVPEQRAGDFAQAMMDLGAVICTAKNPSCGICPWQDNCIANELGIQNELPARSPVKTKPNRYGAAFVAMTPAGEILLRKRPDKGMLAGMSEVPTTNWSARQDGETGMDAAPFAANWHHVGAVQHTFTHFHIDIKVYFCQLSERATLANLDAGQIKRKHWWVASHRVMEEALPSLMKKIVVQALEFKPGNKK